jgi:hypothetical protein
MKGDGLVSYIGYLEELLVNTVKGAQIYEVYRFRYLCIRYNAL